MPDKKTQLYALTKPFPQQFIKEAGSKRYYIPHGILRQRLLQVVGNYEWKTGEVVLDGTGKFVGLYGTLECYVDERHVEITCLGGGDSEDIDGDKLKSAESDAFRRCCMTLGLGLHLWNTAPGDWFLSIANPSENWEPEHIKSNPKAPQLDKTKSQDEVESSDE